MAFGRNREPGSAVEVPAEPATGGDHSPSVPDSRLADDLIRRVVEAIDDWREENDLLSVPREVAFEQAVSIIFAYQSMMVPGRRK